MIDNPSEEEYPHKAPNCKSVATAEDRICMNDITEPTRIDDLIVNTFKQEIIFPAHNTT